MSPFTKYRSRLRRNQEKRKFGVPEPERITLYDLVKTNLKIANRVTFVHRIFYTAPHSHNREDIIKALSAIITKVNSDYCDEKLSGFLLIYETYFIHMVEGDEVTINKHLTLLFEDKEFLEKVPKIKLLVHMTHINRRFSSNWHHFFNKPPALLEKIEDNSDFETASRHIIVCVKKMYGLILQYLSDLDNMSDSLDNEENLDSSEQTGTKARIFSWQKDQYTLYLPEYLLLDFLINTNFTIDLRTYSELYGKDPALVYSDKVWPIPNDFIPYFIFDSTYNPITDLPIEQPETVDNKIEDDNESDASV